MWHLLLLLMHFLWALLSHPDLLEEALRSVACHSLSHISLSLSTPCLSCFTCKYWYADVCDVWEGCLRTPAESSYVCACSFYAYRPMLWCMILIGASISPLHKIHWAEVCTRLRSREWLGSPDPEIMPGRSDVSRIGCKEKFRHFEHHLVILKVYRGAFLAVVNRTLLHLCPHIGPFCCEGYSASRCALHSSF